MRQNPSIVDSSSTRPFHLNILLTRASMQNHASQANTLDRRLRNPLSPRSHLRCLHLRRWPTNLILLIFLPSRNRNHNLFLTNLHSPGYTAALSSPRQAAPWSNSNRSMRSLWTLSGNTAENTIVTRLSLQLPTRSTPLSRTSRIRKGLTSRAKS